MLQTILVTGGCGFIGSNFIRAVYNTTRFNIINVDALTYAANKENLKDIENSPRYKFIHSDIENFQFKNEFPELKNVDYLVNFAAESHVDRSIESGEKFLKTNILGTYYILEAIRRENPKIKFLQVSTDEVYGDIPYPNRSLETDVLCPSSPYAASKASADMHVLAAYRTFGLNVLITRSTNNYGPYQYPEKFIPLFITNALNNKELPLYDEGNQFRNWIHVYDNVRAILLALLKGKSGEIYNIGNNEEPEISNLEVAKMILNKLNKSESLIKNVKGIRPGHDFRYKINDSKIKSLGFVPLIKFDKGLNSTIEWYNK